MMNVMMTNYINADEVMIALDNYGETDTLIKFVCDIFNCSPNAWYLGEVDEVTSWEDIIDILKENDMYMDDNSVVSFVCDLFSISPDYLLDKVYTEVDD